MKTTLNIPDPLFRALKKRAAEQGETMSNLLAKYLRRGLERDAAPEEIRPLPTFGGMGKPLIDLTDREELYRVMDEEKDARLYGRSAPES